jgi:hypothetical protein
MLIMSGAVHLAVALSWQKPQSGFPAEKASASSTESAQVLADESAPIEETVEEATAPGSAALAPNAPAPAASAAPSLSPSPLLAPPKAASTKVKPQGSSAAGVATAAAQGGGIGQAGVHESNLALAQSFTQGFPIIASLDQAWASATLGSHGEARVHITLDDAGRIATSSVAGTASPELARGIGRTLLQMKGRTFARPAGDFGAVLEFRVTGSLATDSVHDGFHGDVFALGKSFQDGRGTAFFALAIGRRMDLVVTLVAARPK